MRTVLVSAVLLSVLPLLCGASWAQPAPRPAVPAQAKPAPPEPKQPSTKQPDKAAPQVAQSPPMQVHIVRSADPACGATCPEWIAAQGRIDATTPREFRTVLARLGNRKLPILIDSPGGSVDESLAVGRLIRNKGLSVAVTRTELMPCQPTDSACRRLEAGGTALGHARPTPSKCASSCAFILAGGARRFVGPGAFVGVHQIASFQTRVKVLRTYRITTRREWGVPVETVKTLVSEKRIGQSTRRTETKEGDYAKLAAYFAEMGIGEGVMRALRATPNSDVYWFSPIELQATTLATDRVDGGQLLAAGGAAAQPARVVQP